jgi:uncharacterized membrane protein
MDQAPSMWRTELWHPLTVHFPIACLLLATAAGLLRAVVNRPVPRLFLSQLSPVLLAVGVVTGWIVIFTGERSYNVVVRTICDPPVLQAHQWWSYASTIVYSAALALYVACRWIPPGLKRISSILRGVLLTAGAAGLLYAGHLGASVVYQQGGGTYKPSADCREFVR